MVRFDDKVFSRDTLDDFCSFDRRLTGRGEKPMLDTGLNEVNKEARQGSRNGSYSYTHPYVHPL